MLGKLNQLFAASLVCLAALGCGGSGLIDTTGEVSVDGVPAEGAVVLFHPEKGGNVASGVADSQGKFKLVSSMEDGVAPGSYKITVTWPDPAKKPSNNDIMMGKAADAPDLLKAKFALLSSSKLVREISVGMKEIPKIEITTK